MGRGEDEMLTRDRLTKALKQIAEMARSALAQGCTTDRGIAAQEAQRAVQEADEYLAAGDMMEAYGLFCFASGKLCDNRAYWKERFGWLFTPEQPRSARDNAQSTASRSDQQK
jgi:hypothetical protein